MTDNIKVINFNKNINHNINNINNNINSNINDDININNEIIFNNNEHVNDNFLNNNNGNIVIEENIALENKNLVYKDDTIYLQELENQLLSNYPVTNQSSKYIIEQVQIKAKDIIDLKNKGIERYNLLNKNIEYKKKLDIINNNFSDSWIIPVVCDKHIIFTNIIEKDINENNEINNQRILTQLKEDPYGYTEIEQKELMQKIKENNLNFEEQKITITEYEEINAKMYKSFIIHNNLKKGYIIHPKTPFNVLRYTDLKNNNWNTHRVLDDINTPVNVYNEDGKIIGLENNLLIRSEEQNIYGFLKLKEGNKNILKDYKNILYEKKYNNHLYKVLYNKKTINKITQTQNNLIHIKITDHEILDDSIIYLSKTNCYPSIDGYYNINQNSKIIDKDTIEISSNKKLKFEGNNGYLFILSKIKYDYYNIDNDLNFNFLHSTYDDKKEDDNNNKLYIFEDIEINKSKYINILNKILPTINDIIKSEKENLEKCFYLDDVIKILDKYYVSIKDIHQSHFDLIMKYMDKNIKSISNIFNNNKKYETINYFYENKQYLKENNYYLNDDYLLNKEVIKHYGEYPYKNKSFDSIKQRYNWLENKDDYGVLFIKLLNLQNHENDKIQLKYIENKLKELKTNIIVIKNELSKDNGKSKCHIYRYSGIKINSLDIDKKINNEYYLLDTILYQWIDNNFELVNNIENEDLLLLDNLELWKFNDKNKIWEFTKEYSKYNKIKYLCEFNNLDINDIDLDSLDCIYRKNFGCYSRISTRYNNKLTELEDVYTRFNNLHTSIKNDIKKDEIKKNIKQCINKYILIDNKNNKKLHINVNIKSFNSSIPVDILIRNIFKLDNITLREHYLYQLIDKDCILIDKNLYSKKYKKSILCGHYYYLKKIYYSDNDNLRQKFIDIIVSIFSDQGEAELNNHICNNCGEKILNNEYDEIEGYAASGALKSSREQWVKEKSFEMTKETLDEYLEDAKIIDCNDDKFNELLLKNGLSIDNLEKAIYLCNFITKTLYPKIGVVLSNGVLINNIIEIIQKINIIIPFQMFKNKEKDKLQRSGISLLRIKKMEEKEYFEERYKTYYEIKKQAAICSRILISIQVNIPNLVISKKTTTCQFNSFNEKEGIEFFACIMKEINKTMTIDKENILETYINFIKEYYDEFKSYYYIKDLLKEKKKYLLSLKKDKIYNKIENKDINITFKNEPKKVEKNVYKNLKNIKKYQEYFDLYTNVKTRNLYVTLKIKEIINDIIGRAPLGDKLGGIIERSACSQDVSTYIDFYQYFEIFNPDTEIFEYIDESKKLNEILDTKLKNYCYHRFKLYDENKFNGVNNTTVVYNGINTTDKFKKSIFINYVNEGEYKGTPRDLVKGYGGIKDVKTGKSLDEIEKEEYTIDELNDLLKSIEQNNLKFIKNINRDKKDINNEEKFDDEFINKLKKDSINGIKIQINLLVSNLVNMLGKNKDYENKLYNIIANIKNHVINTDSNNTIKERINEENAMNNNKLSYYKKIYQKISKYLSIVKNSFEFDRERNLMVVDNPNKKSEMMAKIIDENTKLDTLLLPEISKNFKKIEMKYELNKINSIYGIRNTNNKEGNKTIKYSNFTPKDASILIEYIVYEQLNLLFEHANDSANGMKLAEKTVKNKYVAQFIDIIFDEINEEYELFDICNKNNEFEHLDARFYNAYQLKIITSDEKYEIKDFLKTIADSRGESLDSSYNTLEDDIKISNEKKDIEDSINDKEKFDKIKQDFVENINDDIDLLTLKQIKDRIDYEDGENEENEDFEIDDENFEIDYENFEIEE